MTTAITPSPAPFPSPATAVEFFTARLAFQTDVSDVRAALVSGTPGFVLIDSRTDQGWQQARIPGALHLPTGEIPTRAAALLDPAVPVVTYCWGPGCNGATRAALALSRLGYQAKEMLGGIEYWIREGFPTEGRTGLGQHSPDPLTAPSGAVSCGC
ncbi:rhodanese-like domain-containing protein [Streptomyces sp. 3N207]|uniref:rhodanese-like domain-containing protein n=1 Tax=Streptomyces sp. 3N207 TaxID=3457417 RepID=UPI003FD462ED